MAGTNEEKFNTTHTSKIKNTAQLWLSGNFYTSDTCKMKNNVKSSIKVFIVRVKSN